MSEHFNELSPAEAERLALLLEEMGESIQVIGKILRHGYNSCHPDSLSGPDNRNLLEQELGDVYAAITLLSRSGDVDNDEINQYQYDKLERVQQYLHHQQPPVRTKHE